MTTAASAWDAVVLAGGAATRMGGGDKTSLDVGGRSLLEHALAAVEAADRVIVVGAQRPTTSPVVWCREEPPFAGPAAAVGAALAHVVSPVLVLLAGDQPFIDASVVSRLLAEVADDGAVGVDESGQPQWLCSAWRVQALRSLALLPDASLRRTLGRLRWVPLPLGDSAVLDCDTPDDLRRARELAE